MSRTVWTTHKSPQLVAAALAVVLGAPGVAAADSPTSGKAATTYYISIGDSLASGYQPDVNQDTHIAYTDRLYAQLKQRQPGLKHIRLGCTGETTASLLKGGTCHYPNARSQLDAAAKALAMHRGHVSYVTIDIGANDILECADDTTGAIDQTCVNRAAQAIPKNLAQITRALRQAGTSGTRYAGATYYNPFLAQWLRGAAGQQRAQDSVGLVKSENAAISQVYAAAGFKLADVAGAFSSDDVTHVSLPGYGEVPANLAKICQLTWACTMSDPHPNPLGHQVIASTFAAVLPQSGIHQQAGHADSGNVQDTRANHPKTNANLAQTRW
ncbi:lysophospholipase L1-like esterase [Streptomyces sp. SAI-144]|jgi:lysophospholipase L1-like esterase|uniref:SGNH/GDSL hydrolase family protein n=1 Tax=Streptomyces sp. SAI-144 TaxID=2940544 RepID=UPI00247629D6|nr:SGNH/GDSL hydrolase family protein [Streptomyces sp. SAI-144]MDH6437075.1 lysophospholipase L1-like esterase [Streptomyces sp. SAI-144]